MRRKSEYPDARDYFEDLERVMDQEGDGDPDAEECEKWAHMSDRSRAALLEVANAIQKAKETIGDRLRALAEGNVKAAERKFLESRRQDWDMWREMNVEKEF